jgi:predicted phosphodiesterase
MTERHYGTVAVFADIHANLPALEAVLTQAQASGAEAFVLLGDIALGPMPAPTLDLLDSLGERAIWVHGNCEREVVAAFDATEPPAPNGAAEDTMAAAAATAALLSRGHRDRLAGLPLTVTLDIDGLGPTLFCHASPRRDDEMVLVDSPPERWAAVLADVAAATVVCGHTHMQFDRLAAGHRVINAGSVGMPYGPPGACWALLGPDVTLRRTLYDAAQAARRIAATEYAGARQWAADYVMQHYSDTEALESFTQIASEQAGG